MQVCQENREDRVCHLSFTKAVESGRTAAVFLPPEVKGVTTDEFQSDGYRATTELVRLSLKQISGLQLSKSACTKE